MKGRDLRGFRDEQRKILAFIYVERERVNEELKNRGMKAGERERRERLPCRTLFPPA